VPGVIIVCVLVCIGVVGVYIVWRRKRTQAHALQSKWGRYKHADTPAQGAAVDSSCVASIDDSQTCADGLSHAPLAHNPEALPSNVHDETEDAVEHVFERTVQRRYIYSREARSVCTPEQNTGLDDARRAHNANDVCTGSVKDPVLGPELKSNDFVWPVGAAACPVPGTPDSQGLNNDSFASGTARVSEANAPDAVSDEQQRYSTLVVDQPAA